MYQANTLSQIDKAYTRFPIKYIDQNTKITNPLSEIESPNSQYRILKTNTPPTTLAKRRSPYPNP